MRSAGAAHGVAFDISDLKDTEEALQQERNVVSAILDTVGALVVVLDPDLHIVRFNRACELTTEYSLQEVRHKCFWDFFPLPEEVERFKLIFAQLGADKPSPEHRCYLVGYIETIRT